MADKVRPGQEIEAKQLNAVIDAVSIGQPNATQPFRNTVAGGLVNGGATYVTKARSQFENLFNVTYGPGVLHPDIYALQTESWTGIWAQVADWEQLDLMLYHGTFFPSPVSLFLIDPTAQNAKLIWVVGSTLISRIGKLPICEATHSAGIAVFQVFNSSASGGLDAYNGSCCIVLGDFTKFGADQGWRPDFGGQGGFAGYLNAIKACDPSGSFFGNKDEIALRFSSPLYVQKSDLEDQQLARPVTYSVGQQRVESIPDSDNSAASIGKDVYLSSIEFTPATQLNTLNATPTWSYSLYNFHKKDSDISDISDLPLSSLADYDILLKHKFDHPNDTPVTRDNCKAALEYASFGSLYASFGSLVGTVDSEISALRLSSVQEGAWTDPDTGKDTKYHQFFGFADPAMRNIKLSDDIDIVVRDRKTTGGNGSRTNYVSLSGLAEVIGGGGVSIDSQNTALSSIGKDSGNNLELYRFSAGDQTPLTAAQYDDVVIRHQRSDLNGAEVSYVPLSDLISPPTDTDWSGGDQRSIETLSGQCYQMYNFDGSASQEDRSLVVTLKYDGSSRYFRGDGGSSDSKDSSNKVVVKHYDGIGNVIEYDGLEIIAPKVQASDVDGLDDAISSEIAGSSTLSGVLSGQLSSFFWVQGDSGGSTCYGRSIGDGNKNVVVDLNGKTLNDGNGVVVDWGIYGLYDANNLKVDWGNACLYKASAHKTLDWANGVLYDPNNGNVSLNWDVGYAKDPSGTSNCVINWNTGQLWSDQNTRVMSWKIKQLIGDWTSNGNFTISNGSLTIGNTSLSEAQLQQLLALLNTP